ncbi:J domain-containing protein [Candidatus Dependentiae bacterium]|nr:J domain-containing protein [Candidatus Dependentiae bacterium]
MKKEKIEALKKAIETLELELPVSYTDVKAHYKKLIKKWHPDKCRESDEICKQKTIEIIDAQKILIDYIENYKFKFDEKEISETESVDDWWFKKFGNDSLWGQNK